MAVTSDKNHGSIVYSLLKVIFATYCTVTILVTLFHLFAEYQDAKSNMIEKFHTLESIFAPGLSQALWNLDETQIASHLEGIMESPIVIAVQLESLENAITTEMNPLWSRGHISEQSYPLAALEEDTSETSSFFMNKRLEHQFYLYSPSDRDKQPIGTVRLHSEHALLLKEIQQSAFYIITGALIKTLALWLFFLYFGNKLLRKPLKKLTQAVEETNLRKVESPAPKIATLEGKNEFILLEQSFNEMVMRLRAENFEKNQLQKKNEEVLDFLDDIVTSMPVALIGISHSNAIQHWNPAAERLTGIKSTTAVGEKLCTLLPSLKKMSREFEQAKKERSTFRSQAFELETSAQRVFTQLTAYPLKNDPDESMVILIEDITESVLAEKSMVESEKVITLAGFSAGMAHDINNPLSIISQSAENLKMQLANEASSASQTSSSTIKNKAGHTHLLLDAIETSVTRMSGIVDNMLSFSRNTPASLEPHYLKPIIERTLEFIRRDPNLNQLEIFQQIDFNVEIEASCPQISSVPSQLQQALFNLIKNAIEALQQSHVGEIPIVSIKAHATETHVILIVKDNGPGIPASEQNTLFKPLRSSKGDKGTGLGLFICHTIITKVHHGDIKVTSSSNGTEFNIRLLIAL